MRWRTDRLHPWLVSALWAVGCLGCSSQAPAPRPVAETPPPETRTAAEQPLPPHARVVPHQTEIHGRVLEDGYAWLRDRDNPEVLALLEAENAYAEATLDPTAKLQETLFEEMVARLKESDLSVPYREGDAFYYYRTLEGHQYPDFCRKVGNLEGEEEVLLDGDAIAAGHDYFFVGRISVSPDGRYLAYSYDTEGGERFKLRVRDLESGQFLPDEVSDSSSRVEWGNDNRSLYYVRRDPETNRPYQMFRHVLGSDPATDELLFHERDDSFFAGIHRGRSGRFLYLRLDSIATSEVRYLDLDHPAEGLRLFAPRRDGVDYFVYHHGDRFFVRTNDGAENFKIMETPLEETSWEAWREVIPYRPDTAIEEVEESAGHLALYVRRGGLPRLEILDLESGETHEVQFPEPTYTLWPATVPGFDTNRIRFRYTSLVTPMSVYDYDMGSQRLELLRRSEIQGDYQPSDYVSERIFATAPDGVQVPISLVYRKGLARDGENPCLLEGYGAYGVNLDPVFSISRLSLLDRGFVVALGHVRGGGEMGRLWHEQGKLLNKKNTFTDFIAVAEHLIEAGYTSSDRLGIRASSAGGLLVGAVLNQRPDLFAAAIANVPFVDLINTMLDTSQSFTTFEYDEWGNPNDPEYFDYMLSYSPYDNVTLQEYPDVLVRSALNDPRVGYWEQAKWVARLRAAQQGDGRILLRTDLGGHGGASGRYQALRELAFDLAFLVDALDVTGAD